MAFRKRFSRGRRSSFRKRGQPLARKRVNWFKSYDNSLCQGPDLFPGCDGTQELEGPCCTNLAMLTLINNATLEAEYSDRARVVRMIGQLWLGLDFSQALTDFRNNLALPNTQLGNAQATTLFMSYMTAYMRVGLWKTQIGKDDFGAPLFVGLNPMTDFTYTEGQWKHVWEHAWNPSRTDRLSQTGAGFFSPAACCPTLITPYSAPDILDGTTVPLTETTEEWECQPCAGAAPVDGSALASDFEVKFPSRWHLAWDRKFKIPLRENEQLMLSIGWYANPSTQAQPFGGSSAITQPTLEVFGGIRTLLQF